MNSGYQSGGYTIEKPPEQQMNNHPLDNMEGQPVQITENQLMTTQAQPVYVPAGGFVFVQDPLMELMNVRTAIVKQKFELLEAVTGCETPNRYYVYVKDEQGNKKYLFKAKENSSCLCRYFCPGSCRGFELDLRRVVDYSKGGNKVNFARFKRPFKCTCYCCNRPELVGNFIGEKSGYIGKISEPCTVCDPKLHLSNSSNVIAYTITCNCCQCGYCLRDTCCGKCSEVDFNIFKGSTDNGQPVGNIHKEYKGCRTFVGDVDDFKITFPIEATPEEKVLIIGAVIMMDFLYYEDKSKDGSSQA